MSSAPDFARLLRSRALACLARREHSRAELQDKLSATLRRAAERSGQPAPADGAALVERLLDTLLAQGLLSEQRYMDSRLRTRAPRLGARRLAAELSRQGLQPQGDTWQEVLASETERAQTLLLRRFGEAPPHDARELARRVRFLVSRGFATELALRLVKGNRK